MSLNRSQPKRGGSGLPRRPSFCAHGGRAREAVPLVGLAAPGGQIGQQGQHVPVGLVPDGEEKAVGAGGLESTELFEPLAGDAHDHLFVSRISGRRPSMSSVSCSSTCCFVSAMQAYVNTESARVSGSRPRSWQARSRSCLTSSHSSGRARLITYSSA